MMSRIGKNLKRVVWGLILVAFLAYFIAPELSSWFQGDIACQEIIVNSWKRIWSPSGLSQFQTVFLPLVLLAWFMGYMEAEGSRESRHGNLWHFGTLIKIVGYAALVIVAFDHFLIPLSSIDIKTLDEIRKCLSPYFSTTEAIVTFFGTFIAIGITTGIGHEMQEHSEERKAEVPAF